MADVVASADFDQGLASLSPRDGLLPLVRRELQLAAEPHASGLRALSAFRSARLYELALEFC